jgi:hypothetical protein
MVQTDQDGGFAFERKSIQRHVQEEFRMKPVYNEVHLNTIKNDMDNCNNVCRTLARRIADAEKDLALAFCLRRPTHAPLTETLSTTRKTDKHWAEVKHRNIHALPQNKLEGLGRWISNTLRNHYPNSPTSSPTQDSSSERSPQSVLSPTTDSLNWTWRSFFNSGNADDLINDSKNIVGRSMKSIYTDVL